MERVLKIKSLDTFVSLSRYDACSKSEIFLFVPLIVLRQNILGRGYPAAEQERLKTEETSKDKSVGVVGLFVMNGITSTIQTVN